MKFIQISLKSLVLISILYLASSFDVEQTGKEYTSAYICPMHCKNSGSDQAKKCSECGRDYIINEDYKK